MKRAVFLLASVVCGQDLVLRNGNIITLDPAHPRAQAVAIRGGRIATVGTNEEARFAAPSARVIDLGGKLAIPGFIEGHGHFMGIGAFRMNLNLRDARNWDEIVAIVARAARTAKPGEWIIGRGWHQAKWDHAPQPNVEGFPLHGALSRVSPHNPVLLTHASGHASFANAEALRLAGITRATPSPAGGEILHDTHGEPTGLLKERAAGLVAKAHSEWEARRPRAERIAKARREAELAAEECVSKGITSFQDAGSGFDTVDLLRDAKLPLRLWIMLRASNVELARNLARYRIVGDRLTVRAIKRQIDGALGPRGAWLLEPYSDLPESRGLNTEDPADISATAELAVANGYQLCVHAIGDRANREVLNVYERAFQSHPDKKDLRWRIEHAQHLNAADIPRFGKLGVIASMQGIHCTSDAPFVTQRLGPKRAAEGAYVWQKLLKSGAVVTNGTDAPVEDVDPIACYYATVTRKLADGTAFYPDQRMSREEALRSYTISNAYAAFEEREKGTLAVGKLADVTVLSKDILAVPDDEIRSAKVVYTIVGGDVMYQAK